jgi:predicted negative regulator of RcsB-dependent stress response
MAKGIQRRQLKEPDEFLTLTRRFLEYARQHEREVTFAVLGIVAVVAVALGVRWYRSWQESNAEAAFGAARRDFTAQKFDSAVAGFRRVTSTWPGTSHGHLAFVYLGNSYVELGKTKEAEDAFQQALQQDSNDLLRQIAHYNLGLLKLKAGDKAGAATELGAAASATGPLRGVAWFTRLSTEQQFVEGIDKGMQAIAELSPDTRDYVEAMIAARVKSPPKQ